MVHKCQYLLAEKFIESHLTPSKTKELINLLSKTNNVTTELNISPADDKG